MPYVLDIVVILKHIQHFLHLYSCIGIVDLGVGRGDLLDLCGDELIALRLQIVANRKSGAHILSGAGDKSVGEGLAPPESSDPIESSITKIDFYDYGLTGCANAAQHREEVLASLGLPRYLTVNAMIAAINCLFTKDEFEEFLSNLDQEIK